MLETAGEVFDDAAVLAGKSTPVFFGSASNNFGVQLLLDGFLKHARAQVPRDGRYRGFHPRIPPFPVSSSKSRRTWTRNIATDIAFGPRLLRQIRARHDGASLAFRQEGAPLQARTSCSAMNARRWTKAYPGDVIGLVGHDSFGIGDTLTTDPKILYKEIPRFTPEAFAHLHNPNTAKFKQFRQGWSN